MPYRNRQSQLCDILRSIGHDANLEDGGKPLNVMDPFTFIAFFQKIKNEDNRKEFYQRLKERIELRSELPTDFSGLPSADPRALWYFRGDGYRDDSVLPTLWDLAEQAVNGELKPETFNPIFTDKFPGIKIGKLSQGLFWLNPQKFYPFDAHKSYIKNNGIRLPEEINTLEAYLSVIIAVRDFFKKPYYEISYNAWQYTRNRIEPKEISSRFKTYLQGLGTISDNSVSQYHSALNNRITKIAVRLGLVDYTIFEIYHPDVLANAASLIEKEPDISDNKGQYTNGFNHYKNFCKTIFEDLTLENIVSTTPNLIMNSKHIPLNQILFGPPGTGKTFNTINEAIKIADSRYYAKHSQERDKLRDRFRELLIKDFDKDTDKQIAFCTFHQSFSYEDFVEGIKPLEPQDGDEYLKYKVIDGVFKNICRLADASKNVQQLAKENLVSMTQDEFNRATFYKISLGDSTVEEDKEIYESCIANGLIAIGFGHDKDFTGKNEEEINAMVDEKFSNSDASQINYFKNYLKVGNYVVVSNGNSYIRALGKVTGEYKYEPHSDVGYNHLRKVEWIFKDKEIAVSEFYKNNLMQRTIYKLKSEDIIPDFFIRADKPVENTDEIKNYVLIIDEINRGNVSSIFGELITLIEKDKRTGGDEKLETTLPYSKKPFRVPSNVFIIGTMNTADRSIEALDTALRRRFSFTEMAPNPFLIATEGKSRGEIDGIKLPQMLTKINERIEKLIDKDHKIGHSYFMDVYSLDDLKITFKDKVIPLLEEYFFGDFGKIGLVLGSSFIEKADKTGFDFADFKDYEPSIVQDLKLKNVFTITPMEKWDFKAIYTNGKAN